jgi:Glycosyl hydrolase family 12
VRTGLGTAFYFAGGLALTACFGDMTSGGTGSSSTAASSTTGNSSASGSTSGSTATSGATGSTGGSTTGSGSTTTAANVDCTDQSSDTGTVDTQYGRQEIGAGAAKTYMLQSNWWHIFTSETEDYSGVSFTVHNPTGAAVMSGDNNPMGFPSIFVGAYGGTSTTGSNLPKAVSALTSVPTIYQTNNSTLGTRNHNATYDVWFTANGTPLTTQVSPGMGGAYLMVWMFKPTDRQPRGSVGSRQNQTIAGVDGKWDVWVDTTNPPCVSYVSSTPIDGLAFDLNDFIQDAVTKSYGVTSAMYLSLVFGGFEIWGGADGLQLTKFCVNVK